MTWSDAALADVESIYDYIVRFNPPAAAGMVMAVREAANGLVHFPERGRPVAFRRRELSTVWPYVIRYRIEGERVVILRVRHGKRRPLRG